MSEQSPAPSTMVRTEVLINGRSHLLAQAQDIELVKRDIEEAMKTSGRFVDLTVVGNRVVSVLISPAAQVVISIEAVEFDPRDTGDSDAPFGGHFDF